MPPDPPRIASRLRRSLLLPFVVPPLSKILGAPLLDELYLLASSEKNRYSHFVRNMADSSFPSELLFIEGFGMSIRKDRTAGRGGGVAMYTRECGCPVRVLPT